MALQEFAKSQDASAELEITGKLSPVDAEFRGAWRFPVTLLVIIVGILGTWTAARALVDPDVRRVCGRLLGILLAGLTVAYVAYYLDGTTFAEAPYLLRGATIVWAYPIAGVLIAGSVHRLAELDERFGRAARRTREGDMAFRI